MDSHEDFREEMDTLDHVDAVDGLFGHTNNERRAVDNSNNNSAEGTDTIDIVVPLSSSSQSPETETNDSKKFLEALRRPFRKLVIQDSGEPSATCDAFDIAYNMNHKLRGKAIIFNHTEFDPKQNKDLTKRLGSDKDAADLKSTFEKLRFKVETYKNLTYYKLHEVLATASRDNHKDEDCIVIIILTHGKRNTLYAYDHAYNPEMVWNFFTADRCPSLAGKPKLFFVQACRGDQYDDGTVLLPSKSRTVVDGPGDAESYKIPNQADFLMVFSTAPVFSHPQHSNNPGFVSRLLSNLGYYSWRNSVHGGCFAQALCKVFDQYAQNMDVLSLMTIVNREVAINYQSHVPKDVSQHAKKQVPHVSHTLTRQIWLNNSLPGTLV